MWTKKNIIENLVLIITFFVLGNISGAFIGYKASTQATGETLEKVSPTLDKAIEKETIKNEVTNNHEVNIGKVKKSDSLVIEIKPNTATEQKPDNKIVVPKKDDCVSIEYLSNRERKRLKRKGVLK